MGFEIESKLESSTGFLATYNSQDYTIMPIQTSGDNQDWGMYATMGQLKQSNYGLTVRSLYWSLQVVAKDMKGAFGQ